MKLTTFNPSGLQYPRVGALLLGGGIVDLHAAYALSIGVRNVSRACAIARADVPSDILDLLAGGERSMAATLATLAYAHGLSPDARGLHGEKLIYLASEVDLLAPVPRPGKLIMTGSNYEDHIAEAKIPRPEFVRGFVKLPSCVIGPDAPIVYPSNTHELDYEVELSVIIGTPTGAVPPERALDVIAGYTLVNDVSARDLQRAESKVGNHLLGKNLPTFAPMGPYLVTPDEVGDPQELFVETRVNGNVRQHAHTSTMLFTVADIVSHWSVLGLEPGDVITTGTPAGVAMGRPDAASQYLKPGDVVEIEATRVGVLRNRVVSAL